MELVACLGCCSLAPVMMVGEDVYGRLTPDRAVKVLDGYRTDKEVKAIMANTIVRVGMASCGLASRADSVYEELSKVLVGEKILF